MRNRSESRGGPVGNVSRLIRTGGFRSGKRMGDFHHAGRRYVGRDVRDWFGGVRMLPSGGCATSGLLVRPSSFVGRPTARMAILCGPKALPGDSAGVASEYLHTPQEKLTQKTRGTGVYTEYLNTPLEHMNFASERINFAQERLNFALECLSFALEWLNFAQAHPNTPLEHPNKPLEWLCTSWKG